VSADPLWQHREIPNPVEYRSSICGHCEDYWPCDAEKMRVERDAAIRRAEGLDPETLAKALIESGLMRRFIDYAHRAHPETMYDETPEQVAASWAPDIIRECAALRSQESQKPPGAGVPQEER
jgi:hypothetical protein